MKTMILIRHATLDDSNEILKLSNEETLRRFSFQSKKISRAEHKTWFTKKIRSKKCLFLVLARNGKIIGQMRFDFGEHHAAKVSIGISRAFQGKGYGKMFLTEAIESVARGKTHIKTLKAHIKTDNAASQKLFLSLGFQKKKTAAKTQLGGQEYILQI